ncbi:hypothetical protein CRENBAI_005529, partial [Crenichthys baileyi]
VEILPFDSVIDSASEHCGTPVKLLFSARSQSMSSFERRKLKTEASRAGDTRLVRHETGPDGHLRQSRLGLFTCFTLGH